MKRRVFCFLFFTVLVLLVTFAWADSTPVEVYVEVTYGQTEARSMLAMINEFRTGGDAWFWNSDDSAKVYLTNLQPLVYDYDLEKTAMQRAAETAVYYSHTRPNNTRCFTAFPANRGASGENIAYGQRTANAAYMAWREDNYGYSGQGHRRNMLGAEYNFNCIGIGHVKYNGVDFWVHSLAYRSSPNTTATAANNSKQKVKVEISPDLVSSVTVNDAEVEVFQNMVTVVYFRVNNGRSFEYLPVSSQDNPAWQVSNPGTVSVSGRTLNALNAGSTVLTATILGKDVSWNVSVTPKDISSVTITPDDGALVYTGRPLVPALTVLDGTRSLTYNKDYRVTCSNNINASESANVTVTGIGNYTGTANQKFRIAKTPLTVTANDNTIIYGDEPAGGGVTYSGFVNGETERNLSGSLSYRFSYSRYGNVGSGFTISPTGLQSINYAITYADGELTVEKKAVGLAWSDTALSYNGTVQAPKVTLTGLVNRDAVTPTLTGGQTKPGTYTAAVSALNGDKAGNYVLSVDPSVSYTINKADIAAATVTLAETPVANGLERKQNVKSVVMLGKNILSECTVSGDRYTTPGTFTLTLTAVGSSELFRGSVNVVYTVPAPLPGDVTEDFAVDGRDTVRLMKYLAGELDPDTGEEYYINRIAADVTGDGKPDELDLLRIVRYLAGEISSLQ